MHQLILFKREIHMWILKIEFMQVEDCQSTFQTWDSHVNSCLICFSLTWEFQVWKYFTVDLTKSRLKNKICIQFKPDPQLIHSWVTCENMRLFCTGRNIVFVLSVCLFVRLSSILIFITGFWTVKDTDLIFGMKTPQMMSFQMTSEGQCPCNLDFDRYALNYFGHCCRQAHHRTVSQTHLLLLFLS